MSHQPQQMKVFFMKHIWSILAIATAMTVSAPAMADNDARIYQQNKAQYITHAKAGEIAKAHVKGVAVAEVEFDHSHFRGAHFDVDVIAEHGVKYEVVVDAKTGKVLHSEMDD